ncbi:MAG: inositol monophosphatase [Acidothermus sp.]|nr:inositol monophosphatase [Acidothermus sp.]MCL6537150.1 inositol monophosphatase [Acidothermus sp.]
MADVDPADLLDLAVRSARAAGRLLLAGVERTLAFATKSTPTDVVTEMDTAAERLIRERIRAERPKDGLLGEEGGEAAAGLDTEVRWIIDPIDGTVNYLYRIPQWAVSIAAEVAGEVIVGVVYDPSKDELYTAVRGEGAWLNGTPIRVRPCAELGQALVGTGFGYAAARRARQAEILTGVLPVVRDIRRLGSAALDLCAVACGRFDAYFERGLNLWDFAAAGLVATEAGARVGGLNGAPPSSRLVVAATPGVFDALHDVLASLGADHD